MCPHLGFNKANPTLLLVPILKLETVYYRQLTRPQL